MQMLLLLAIPHMNLIYNTKLSPRDILQFQNTQILTIRENKIYQLYNMGSQKIILIVAGNRVVQLRNWIPIQVHRKLQEA
jgi:hypothetical protein